jgi:hypothetical protein
MKGEFPNKCAPAMQRRLELRDYSWWPRVWVLPGERGPSAADVSANGILQACRLSVQGLTIVGICCGEKFSAVISHESAPSIELKRLQWRLSAYLLQPMRIIENLDWPQLVIPLVTCPRLYFLFEFAVRLE